MDAGEYGILQSLILEMKLKNRMNEKIVLEKLVKQALKGASNETSETGNDKGSGGNHGIMGSGKSNDIKGSDYIKDPANSDDVQEAKGQTGSVRRTSGHSKQ